MMYIKTRHPYSVCSTEECKTLFISKIKSHCCFKKHSFHFVNAETALTEKTAFRFKESKIKTEALLKSIYWPIESLFEYRINIRTWWRSRSIGMGVSLSDRRTRPNSSTFIWEKYFGSVIGTPVECGKEKVLGGLILKQELPSVCNNKNITSQWPLLTIDSKYIICPDLTLSTPHPEIHTGAKLPVLFWENLL